MGELNVLLTNWFSLGGGGEMDIAGSAVSVQVTHLMLTCHCLSFFYTCTVLFGLPHQCPQ